MKRRTFLIAVGAAAFGSALSVHAQPTPRVPRVAFVFTGTPVANARRLEAFRQAMHELGWVTGKTVIIEDRYAEGRPERVPQLIADLVRMNVDLIVVNNTLTSRTAKSATASIPVVLAGVDNPVESKLVSSLSHPGGNVTGLTTLVPALSGKRLELLRQAIPSAKMGVLWTPSQTGNVPVLKETEAAAQSAGVSLQPAELHRSDDIDAAFSAFAKASVRGVIVLGSAMVRDHAQQIIKSAAKYRIATMFHDNTFVSDGGLMSYGPNIEDVHRRAAAFVDKILKGAKPRDLPIEQPDRYDLAVNLRTAKALGITIPQAVLLQASRIVE